jgi:nickel transport protein
VDSETLRAIVEEAVEAKVAPMRASLDGLQRQVAELGKDRGPGLVEILGGIGWIIGLMGLFVWLKRPAGEKA